MTGKTSPATSVSDRAMSAVMAKDRGAWLDCFAEDALLR
ncbi:nuclear transport factor 2 family protein, partial [Salinispora arenicola]|nr:nuclear transport factor 2 family protein [Salinispora arenicola]